MVKTEHLRGNVFEIHAFSSRVAHAFARFAKGWEFQTPIP
jgi:hypothetical protein